MNEQISPLLDWMRAAGEPNRLRVLALLRQRDLSVGELVSILDHSQPRISHHLKALTSAGLVERMPEGAFVFYRAATRGPARDFLDSIFRQVDRSADIFAQDSVRLEHVSKARAVSAEKYFSNVADRWDAIRALHYPNAEIEKALMDIVGAGPFRRVVDFGTGTGRMLALLAPRAELAEGIDISHKMLNVARANLQQAGLKNAKVRQGDVSATPFDSGSADLVIVHQVLHFMDAPGEVIAEASRVLAPGGRLVVVDFAPHEIEAMRADYGHRRLGIRNDAMHGWAKAAGLDPHPVQSFEPPERATPGLTVDIWSAEKPAMDRMSNLAIASAQAGSRPSVSFEFFPPKSDKMAERLWETVERLEPMAPNFVSVTYGAGGSTRERTHDTVKRIVSDTKLRPAAHLTCVSASKKEVLDVARSYADAGVRHIVALRGDAPEGMGAPFSAHPDGFNDSVELIRDLRDIGDFEISVSCYPEPHPDSHGGDSDIAFLKAKQDAGATRAITQFFFEPETYLRFTDRARSGGVTMPIVPGIMLQPNFKGLARISKLCGASVPSWLHRLYDGLEDDSETCDLVTATTAAELCHKLAAEGVDQFHFYTLNRAGLALSTCRLLGLKPTQKVSSS